VRDGDLVARPGGDEFGVLLVPGSERLAVDVAHRIMRALATPLVLRDRSLIVDVSIGVALARNDKDAEAILRGADAAMYRAKRAGGARYAIDQPGETTGDSALDIETSLRRAVKALSMPSTSRCFPPWAATRRRGTSSAARRQPTRCWRSSSRASGCRARRWRADTAPHCGCGSIRHVATVHDEGERTHPEGVEAWSAWLERNCSTSQGVWLVSWKKRSGKPAMTYEEAVSEALRFGWVDSRGGKLDDDRTMLWFSPRRKGSAWSGPNKRRIQQLETEGRMAAQGRAKVEAAKADGSWSRLEEVEALVVPDDLAAAFSAHPGSRAQWDNFPPSARRGILEWIVQAKRVETRAKRVTETARLAARGERANQWRPR
jgi:uncharacterized protein YdeI (YjbR/CyaY-like superfamily)